MYEIMIIGGGPAGLSASVYAARKRLKTLLVSQDIGGQMNMTLKIENYLGYQFITAQELVSKFQEQISQFPIEQKIGYKIVEFKTVENNFEAKDESGTVYQSKTVIFATGKKPARLDVPGEVEYTGRGVSYCGICDGPLFSREKVAIIGGGNSAIQTVLDMVPIASHIYLVSKTKLTADPVLLEKLLNIKNMTVFIEHTVENIRGEKLVTGIEIREPRKGKIRSLDVAGIFIEIGMSPNSEIMKGILPLNEKGEVPINCASETSILGLYAAGDVTDIPEKQILVAAGEGAKAAIQAHRYLQRMVS